MAKFAEIIIPLPLYSTFTYEVPEDMAEKVKVGILVLVQFGKKKFYTGIIVSLHEKAPSDFSPKPITAILSETPIIRHPQLKLWQWISDYYLCSPGDIYRVALPTGLKPESETFVTLNPEAEQDDLIKLNEKEAAIYQIIEKEKRIKISDLSKMAENFNAIAIVNSLLKKGVVEIDEKVVDRYRPKKITMVRINAEKEEHDKLHDFFNLVNKSTKQEKALVALLEMSKWLSPNKQPLDVSRHELQKRAEVSPGIIKALSDKEIIKIYTKKINRFDTGESSSTKDLFPLTEIQKTIYNEIKNSFTDHNVSLLHGVTGSGKTEIYMHLINHVLNQGHQVLYLVPEISLTTQLTDRLRNVFGNKLIVYHSKFSDNERVDIWNSLLKSNEPKIILGARSSVFLPFARLGLIIIDEEHDTSFKQYDPAPRYNARDTAIVLASMHGAKTLLGSGTPSIETYFKALKNKFGLITLTERYKGATLPEVKIIDMSKARKEKRVSGALSFELRDRVEETIHQRHQAIIFQNRRGFAPYVICHTCGWTPKCKNCDVSMVYHKNIHQLRCHYCGSFRDLPTMCPACGENDLIISGFGTERVADEIENQFPGYNVCRMDLDSTRSKNAYLEMIENFSNHTTDILVGTQMITKGLDFENVTLVGVINADSLLNFPDFRANERAFNTLEQVAGRAGRKEHKGCVMIQTTKPDHQILNYVITHDYLNYYKEEIKNRKILSYPPYSRIINIYIKHRDQQIVNNLARTYAEALRNIFGSRVLGPEKPFVARVSNWYIQTIMLKIEVSASMAQVKEILRTVYESMSRDQRMKRAMVYYDVDPV